MSELSRLMGILSSRHPSVALYVWLRRLVLRLGHLIGEVLIFVVEICRQIISPPFRLRSILYQVDFIGSQSFFVTVVAAFFTGAVFGLQIGHIFSMFRSQSLIGAITCDALTRELSPLITGFLMAGRVGSSMTAEVAAMKFTEQIDALKVMAVSPMSYLVVPRVVGSLIAIPALNIVFLLLGSVGAFMASKYFFYVDYGTFIHHTLHIVTMADLVLGFWKSVVFAAVISITSCYFGMKAQKGKGGISVSTTQSVVTALLLILILDALITFMDIVIL
ncbi:MAG: ABC transporter permease [Proteobacteria bacterium]|nr:ABC transporter permease [Pseudomonadota bacterium]